MKRLILTAAAVLFSSTAFSGLPEMMKIYNNPKSAPAVAACKGSIDCNAFYALSKQINGIPKSYSKRDSDLVEYAMDNDFYSLGKGYDLYGDTSKKYSEAGAKPFYYSKDSKKWGNVYTKGYAVLVYIEDMNGWRD